MTEKIQKTEEEWRAELTPEQFQILRERLNRCSKRITTAFFAPLTV